MADDGFPVAREGRFDTRRDCHASLGMTGSFDRLRTNGGGGGRSGSPLPSRERGCPSTSSGRTGGSPSPQPSPIEGEGMSFDRLRTNGGFALTPALSHRGRGDVLRQAQDERGGSPSPQPSPIEGEGDVLRRAQDERGAVRDSRLRGKDGGGCQYLRRKGAGTPRICFRTTDQTSAIAARTDAVSRPMIFTPTPLLSGSVVTPARTWG